MGRTPAYLAKKYGCTVVGIDIREKMIARSRERAQREGLEGLLEFRVADAQELPFDDALFDVVTTESVVVMILDQEKALSEFMRVLKPGGYVGLNEATWQKEPTPDLEQYLRSIWGADINMHDAAGYRGLLEGAGLHDVVAQVHPISASSETRSRFKRIGYGNVLRMWGKALSMLRNRQEYRDFLKTAFSTPKAIISYWAAGIYVGRK